MFSYFRVDDFTAIRLIKTTYPAFNIDNLLLILKAPFYEYYRPTGLVIWWIGYLLGGVNPTVYHIITSILFGLICVNIYFIGRYQSTELSGWLASLCFMTFAPIVVVSWWISNFGFGFGGMLFYTYGVLAFLYLSRSPRLLIVVSLLCFLWAFFAKYSFVFLAPLPLVLYIFNIHLRTRRHLVVSVGTILLSGVSVLISRLKLGEIGKNSHVHLNIFDIPPEMIVQNLSDYWSLLVYGHSPFLVITGLIYGAHNIQNNAIRIFSLPVVFVLIALMLQWPPGILILALLALCITAKTSDWQARAWGYWIVAGLAQTMFWDVRIIGGLLNRFILESSVGFALLLGHGLTGHMRILAHQITIRKKSIIRSWFSRHSIFPAYLCLIILGTSYHLKSYIYPSFLRDLTSTYNTSYVIRDVLANVDLILPREARLIVENQLVDGIEHYTQLNDALEDINRGDINTVFHDRVNLPAVMQNMIANYSSVYLLLNDTFLPIESEHYRLSSAFSVEYGNHGAWIYQVQHSTSVDPK
ncbi:MAG: hypothetical protein VYA69_05420 [Gemmatimonadota bacterium]|nr:hypothetical protein [Gemmatimonadota bacterium]